MCGKVDISMVTRVCAKVYECTCMYVCMYVCICACTYAFICAIPNVSVSMCALAAHICTSPVALRMRGSEGEGEGSYYVSMFGDEGIVCRRASAT